MTKPLIFRGCATALITPFQKDHPDRIDSTALHALIHQQVTADIDALVVAGTTGEASALSPEEHRCLITQAKKHAGSTPIIAGCGAPTTAGVIALARDAADAGADAILVVTPYYNKCSQEGLYRHYMTIADASAVPVILYEVPSRTGMSITAETYGRLAQLERVVAVKEANADLGTVLTSLPLFQSGELALYSGNDDLTLPIIACGGKGVISVLSNVFPRETVQLCRAALAGNMPQAAKLQADLMPYIKALFADIDPMPVKYAMRLAGLDCGECRLPLCVPSEEAKKMLKELVW
jgi:4-hydroxy-tetrahydrodipicolinate synthase